ncbi:hypothetical protein [Polycladidibacter stylochi]|uniref:hypothetical protein n=1 Tax=Polycladidibacter stylochi TaxID=1807766 RepID=UPI000836C05E|nr:hypothetical protein [Pseudovibrio stylochi]
MIDYCEIYFRAKAGGLLKDDAGAVKSAIFSQNENIPYHAMLAFGLCEDPSKRNLERVADIADICFLKEDDDLLKACLITGCIYWDTSEKFCQISRKVLDVDDESIFQESAITAVTCVSTVARANHSEELLAYLVSLAKKSLIAGERMQAKVLTDKALYAATGEKWITSSQRRAFLDEAALNSIQFGMPLPS